MGVKETTCSKVCDRAIKFCQLRSATEQNVEYCSRPNLIVTIRDKLSHIAIANAVDLNAMSAELNGMVAEMSRGLGHHVHRLEGELRHLYR